MPDTSGAALLDALTPEEQEAVDNLAGQDPAPENTEETRIAVRSAFVILTTHAGETKIASLATGALLDPDSQELGEDEIYSAVSTVAKDIVVGATARATTQNLLVQMSQIQQQVQAQQLAASLNLPGVKH